MTDPAAAYVRARLAELERVLEAGERIAGRPTHGLILPPPDEDLRIEWRIALYRAWLARWTSKGE